VTFTKTKKVTEKVGEKVGKSLTKNQRLIIKSMVENPNKAGKWGQIFILDSYIKLFVKNKDLTPITSYSRNSHLVTGNFLSKKRIFADFIELNYI